ncbi:hypothetical protein [Mycobacterium sp. UM_CSW]|uniref:hypothetical protein n=1 Tax=Mycobacterium sp. UM_CSW TaxID=1370119 RepID=UPI0004031A44|nr:hypothetical protein [Mycobacterium sp. UM_CSW]
MDFDEHCRGDNVLVSFIAAAPADAGFAALLTGFMISAIAFLLGRERREDKILHAVALFAPGLLVLALACNQFVGITAQAPAKSGDHVIQGSAKVACSIGWTQGTTANGMLGVGFVVAVAGLVWMMAHAVDGNIGRNAQENGAQDRRTLIHLGNFLVFVAIATVSLLLTRGSLGYYDLMGSLGVHAPSSLKAVAWWTFGLSMAVDARIIYVRTAGYYRVRRKRIDGEWDERKESTAARLLRRGPVICVVVLTAGMALVAPLHASLISNNSVPGGVAAFFAVVLGMFFPLVIFLFISASVPGPDFWYWDAVSDTKEDTTRPPAQAEVDGRGGLAADPREVIDTQSTATVNGRIAPK